MPDTEDNGISEGDTSPEREDDEPRFVILKEAPNADALLEMLDQNDADAIVLPLAADPFTWGWLGLKIAEGAVLWAAKEILSDLIGQKKIDFSELIKQFALHVQAIVRQELRADALREAVADVRTAENLYRDYLASSEVRYLEAAHFEVEKATNRLRSLGLLGHHSFIVAQGLQLVMLQEAWEGSDQLRQRIVERAQEGAEHLDAMHKAWYDWHVGRYEIVNMLGWKLLRDGVFVRKTNQGKKRIQRYRREHIARDWENEVHPVEVRDSELVASKWREIRA